MKAIWKNLPLESICHEITDGSHFSPKTSPSGYPYITVRDIENDRIDFENCKYVNEIDYNQLVKNGCKPNKGDILFSKDGTVGKVAQIDFDEDFVVLSSLAILRPNNRVIDSTFLKYVLKSPMFLDEALGKKTGVAIRRIILRNLKSIKIPLPPLPEQKRIVAILDEAFTSIDTAKKNTEKNLKNARELFESYLNEVFTKKGEGWEEKTLEKIGSTQTGSTPKSSEQGNYGDFIPFIKPADFNRDGSLNYENAGLSEHGFKTARLISKNSVLMVCIGATIGKCGWCDRDVTSNQQINAFTPKEGIFSKFIYYQMLTENFQKRVLHSSGQATLPIINKSKWSSLTVLLPQKYAEQERISNQLDKLMDETNRLESIYQRKLTALDELKKSLLHQAFSGQL